MKARKMFLKPFAILMAVCMLVQLGSVVGAVEKTEIVVNGVADKQKAQHIADTIKGEVTISPFGIACLFGHSMAQGTAIETNHRYYATAPRCRRVTYKIDYCTRSSCNYITYTQTTVSSVYCCS